MNLNVGENPLSGKLMSFASDDKSFYVMTTKFKVILTLQFLSVGLVFAYGPCAAFHFYFDSLINHSCILAGGLCGNMLVSVLLKSLGLRYTVLASDALLFGGWIGTFWMVQCFLTFENNASLYFSFFVNGISIGMLIGTLLPHLYVYWQNDPKTKDLYYWPQLGIALGIGLTELLFYFGSWLNALVFCLIVVSLSMLTCPGLPNTYPNFLKPRFCDDVVQDGDLSKSVSANEFIPADNGRKQLKTVQMVCMQQATGLGILSMLEIIGMNIARDPQLCFRIFSMTLLMVLIGIRLLPVNIPTKLKLPSRMLILAYLLLCFMYYHVQKSGAFLSLSFMFPVLALMGTAAAIGKLHVPMVARLLNFPPTLYYETMRNVLNIWWCFGFLFSLQFAYILFAYNLNILFVLMAGFCLLISVICKITKAKKSTVIRQLV